MTMNQLDRFNHVDLLHPSKYLKGAELMGKTVTVVIDGIDPRAELKRTDGTVEHRPLLRFKGKDKMMVLNKTNAQAIARMHGTEVKQWIGKAIKLRAEKVTAFGKDWDALRVVVERGAKQQDDGALYDPDTGEVATRSEPGSEG
jgi:hypothetical protein